TGDLVAGLVQRLDGVRPLLDGEPVGANRRLDPIAVEDVHQPPDADGATVVGVRQRGDVDGDLGILLEPSALAERLVGDPERAADIPAVRPLQGWFRPLYAAMHGLLLRYRGDFSAVSDRGESMPRHGRACPGHPRLASCVKGVDARAGKFTQPAQAWLKARA